MRYVRLLGLAVFAAVILLSCVSAGAALASSTALCKSSAASPYCEQAETYPAKTPLSGTTNLVEFKTIGTIHCSSTLAAENTAESAKPLGISVTSMTFSGCNFGCTVTAKPAQARAEWRTGANGVVEEMPPITVNCTLINVHCTYHPGAFSFNGGSKAHLVSQEVSPVGKEGTNCPASTKLSADYTIESPAPLYVAVPISEKPATAGTRLCSKETVYCPTGDVYPTGTVIEAEATDFKIATNLATVTCGKATLRAETAASVGEPLPVSGVKFTFSECAGLGSCALTATEGSGGIELYAPVSGSPAELTTKSEWDLRCGVSLHCTYDNVGIFGEGTSTNGANPAKITYAEETLHAIGGSPCPATSKLTAHFTVLAPKPLYFTD